MGYYTRFDITAKPPIPDEKLAQFEADFEVVTGYGINASRGEMGLEGKWYDHDKNMVKLSILYADHVFQLDGVGEEDGDVWRMYYRNGKSHSAETKVVVTHAPFDETKLR